MTTKLGRPPITNEIYEDISKRGRPPLKKNLPQMLRSIGFEEKDGGWVYKTNNNEIVDNTEQSNEDVNKNNLDKTSKNVKAIVERLEQEGKPVTAKVVCKELGIDNYEHRTEIVSHLRKLDFKVTAEIDPESNDNIMRRIN